MKDGATESFEEFKDSFAYGARNDLSFKFLKGLSSDEAGEFFSRLLEEVGELFDGTSTDRLIDLVYKWQVRAYQPEATAKRTYVYEDRPFTPLAKPLSETTVGLVTSSGHFVSGDDPSPLDQDDMTQDWAIAQITEFLRAVPVLSEIPRDLSAEEIRVRHPGYDIRSVSRDLDVALPRTPLIKAEHTGRIGRLAPNLFSFVGACSQGRLNNELDDWVQLWKSEGIEALFLVPV
ncbi:MAG: glycine/sarcosine/betaine reductase selenoprotein B family protein [Acidimicrobiia bacterium]